MSEASKKKKVILITGGSGLIGYHLIKFLSQNSAHDIVCLDLLMPKKKIEGVIYYKADVSDYTGLNEKWKFIEERIGDILYVFHLASLISIPSSIESPLNTYQVNINGSINVFECCRFSKNIKSILFLSTHTVLHNMSPYATSKLCCEKIAQSYYSTYGLPLVVCRLANVFGPMQPAGSVIPSIISQMLNSNKLKIGNLDSIRDFIFVEDVALALAKVAFSEEKDFYGDIVNIGTGSPVSIGKIVNTIQCLLNFKGEIKVDSMRLRNNDDNYTLPDISFLKEKVSFCPGNSLKEGLKKTIKYFKESSHEKYP